MARICWPPALELPAVSERLGQSSVFVAATVYSHRVTGRDKEAAKKWDEFQKLHDIPRKERLHVEIHAQQRHYRGLPQQDGNHQPGRRRLQISFFLFPKLSKEQETKMLKNKLKQ
jgi:hypothetical protein